MNGKAICIARLIVFSIILAIILVLVFDKSKKEPLSTPPNSSSLVIVKRSEWNAVPPKYEIPDLELPSVRIIIRDTETESCTQLLDCAEILQEIQYQQMNWFDFADIRFNFYIGGDGAVYVGRGWNTEGDHTTGYNKRSIGIDFIGTFDDKAPSKRQLDAAQQLVKLCIQKDKLSSDYHLYGQYQMNEAESPTKMMYQIIRKWDHWTEVVE